MASRAPGWSSASLAFALGLLLALAFCAWRVLQPMPPALRGAGEAGREASAAATPEPAVRAALRDRPLDGSGYRLLGQAALKAGQPERAAELFTLAGARAPRDLQTQAWLVNHALQSGDEKTALSHLDLMLRVQPELEIRLYPVLAGLVERPASRPALADLLLRRPPWRLDFLRRLFAEGKDLGAIFELASILRHGPGGLDGPELELWLDRLIRDRQWAAAYLTWVGSLDAKGRERIGNVFNGGFELEPSSFGFDWRFERIPGARISREQTTGATGSKALRIAFEDRRVPFANVRQLLALAPGSYRFSGRVRLEELRTERGLVWTLSCAGDSRTIAETQPFSGRQPWREFEQAVTVPDADCGGQWLTLRLPARIPAEQRIGGVIWFDELQLQRVSLWDPLESTCRHASLSIL